MRYLYGDSTSFPLNENFIETLVAATDTCVALLEADEALQRARKTADDANAVAMAELGDIDHLSQRVARSLAQRDRLSKATGRVAAQVAEAAERQFERAREGVKAWREATIQKANEGCGPAAVMAPLHTFLVRHQLPYTVWGLRWKAGMGDEPVQAQVYAIMQRGLTATLAVDIPRKHFWSQPVRVAQLERKLTVSLPHKGWFGREKLRAVNLDRYYITRVTRTTEREALVLSRRAKEPSAGLRIVLREMERKRVTVQRIGADEQALGEPMALEGLDAVMVQRLWSRVEDTVADLVAHRSQLLQASLYGKAVHDLDTPATVSVAVISAVAPLVRDMQRHSRTAGELQLKRDLGDGRREELFIAHEDLVRKWSRLSAENQTLFDEFGLQRAGRPSLRAVRAPAPVAPPPSAPVGLLPAAAPSDGGEIVVDVEAYAVSIPSSPRVPTFDAPPPASAAPASHIAPAASPPPAPSPATTSSVPPPVSGRASVRLPPPSVPPPRRKSGPPIPKPNLRVVNG
jgi:hypothetical protein